MALVKVERELGGRTLSIETGRIAKQAHGAALVRYGDTVILATAVRTTPRAGIDFFPLTVEYREMTYAAGKIPGGFFKREGRPSTKETLTMRMIDRPVRPLFPDGFMDEVQIVTMVLSADQDNDADMLAIIGASAALGLSPIPWDGPLAAVRVGLVDGQFIVNPTHAQREAGAMEILAAGPDGLINMIEVAAQSVPDAKIVEALEFAQEAMVTVLEMQKELIAKAGKPKTPFNPPRDTAEIEKRIEKDFLALLRKAKHVHEKIARITACHDLELKVIESVFAALGKDTDLTVSDVKRAWYKVEERLIREMLLSGERTDGRKPDELRPITCEVGVLPRTHGSALFSRGETQAMVLTTLGTGDDQQIIDGLIEEYKKPFMLHYNFPPFSVGEVKMMRGPSRRDIGHGALAEKSIAAVIPDDKAFPYTIRIVSEIMESNGSSSMATVCGATLSLMDAGVPIKDPVAGISIGRISEGSKDILLVDIQGEEDHIGDMDFKVAGTQHGVTGLQLDLKIRGLTIDTCRRAIEKAREVRLEILKTMLGTIKSPRAAISMYAPRLLQVKINPDKIGKLIGPGGKTIKGLEAATGAHIEIEDDGTVTISSVDAAAAEKARNAVEALTQEVQVGRIYTGTVVTIKDFGVFIEILPGQDGMCHVSELSDKYVKNASDVVKVGDQIQVKVIAVDDTGRIKLSRKALLKEEAAKAAGKEPEKK